MLYDAAPPRLSHWDQEVFRAVVPAKHCLRKVLQVVPWHDFHELLAPYYCRDVGRPAESPVLMLKLEYLRYHYNLSDREVISRGETDLAFRYFLQLPLCWGLPDPSSLCIFRGRLGREGFRRVFRQVVRTAREYGVVKDRLRIKDATHVIGNMAVPTALALVAQTRDKLLAAASPFAPLLVEGERVNLEMLREATQAQKPAQRLASRVAQLRGMLAWADAVALVRQEEAAQGNDVQAMSIDGAGFNGPLLRELEDPDGLNVDTYVPPPKESESKLFTPQDFAEDAAGQLTCPAGQTSKERYRDNQEETTTYRFEATVCRACPLLPCCMKQSPGRYGRTVRKTDYQAEHRRARAKATTPQYAAVRREHPKVERKLGEVMNRHGGRQARYRGLWKVLIQELMACTAANIKRLVRLGCAPDVAISH